MKTRVIAIILLLAAVRGDFVEDPGTVDPIEFPT